MNRSEVGFAKSGCIIFLALVISQNQGAFAGWSGLINGLGVGWASVNVRSSTLQTNRVTTVNNLTYPSAAMAPALGYKTNSDLPSGASINTYSRIKGLSGGVWQAAAKADVGDGTDNPELQKRITVLPADCASLTLDSRIDQSQDQFNANGNSGTITVNAHATAGTALWLRGFEFTGSMSDVPADDPNTVENESIEYLKTHAIVKFETLVLGPFDFGGPNNTTCPLVVPFTLTSSNLEHLIFAADGVTLSLPLVVVCPPNQTVECDKSLTIPPIQYAGCGDITLTYSRTMPPDGVFPAGSLPFGVNPITVTATDGDGNSTSCTFNITVTDSTPPVVPQLPTVTGTCTTPVTLTAPTTTDNCAGTVTGTTSDPLTYSGAGTYTVHWTFSDGHGNSSTANQTVISSGIVFNGFDSPINGTGGTCKTPLRTATVGNNIPVKFTTSCGGVPYESGRPTLSIDRSVDNTLPCANLTQVLHGDFVMVSHEWHFNWDTTGLTKGNYKLTATLQDGSTQYVWVKLK